MTSKNQVTLPTDLVRLLNWTAGTDLWVKEQNKTVILERIPTIEEIRNDLLKNPRVKKLNAKHSSVEIVRMVRRMKPQKHLYEY